MGFLCPIKSANFYLSSLVNETNYYFFLQNQTANKNVWNIKSNDVQSPFWPQLLLKNNWMNW